MTRKATTDLGIAPSRHAFDKIRTLVFNRFQVEVKGIPGQVRDTDFSYYLSTDTRVTKGQVKALNDYIAGIIDTIRSY